MTKINLTTKYEFVSSTIESGAATQFVQSPDEHEHSVLWWGESLLYALKHLLPSLQTLRLTSAGHGTG